ncbi:phosphate-starvation-inducible PsiE family protein [Halotalea alkalilenta]|uniref:phosphate-starvation-inducible PsiE family protein n=1 Tax=Halotalea alkalilenta TaxID=376489 RepID=UPI0006950605|nr:phosphate-starvation-inducible PsiE family protein [Halotalea alkalilenta]
MSTPRGRLLDPFRLIERSVLILIIFAVVVAIVQKALDLWTMKEITVIDLLLLFMYLELIAMAQIYWRQGRLSVLLPIFIAVIGLARHLMAESQELHATDIIAGGGAILLLAISALVIAYSQRRYPGAMSHGNDSEETDGPKRD